MQLVFDIGSELWTRQESVGGGAFQVFNIRGQFPTLGSLISTILPNLYILAGVIFFFLLLFGGILIISAAGKGDSETAKKGQQAMTAAALGFLIIFCSYWIIKIVEVITGLSIFNNPTL